MSFSPVHTSSHRADLGRGLKPAGLVLFLLVLVVVIIRHGAGAA